jgi:hypothetical protein
VIRLGRFSLYMLVGLSCLPFVAKPDCMACWSLRGVSIELSNGTRVQGYVAWNDGWVDQIGDSLVPFPESLLRFRWNTQHILLYTELERVKYPAEGLVVATAVPLHLVPDSLRSVVLSPDALDGYAGAGTVPLVTKETAKLLTTTAPIAACHGESPTSSDIYWLSYNSRFDEERLMLLCKEPWISLIEWSQTLEVNRVIRLEYSWD